MKIEDAFFALTPERVLEAVETGGGRATGYVQALNSLENRVYEVEMEDGARLVAKFYRPARWSKTAIMAEHNFLRELEEAELPVVAPRDLGGQTLREMPVEGGCIYFAVSDKVRGRPPEELAEEQYEQLGRLVARLHQVGSSRGEPERPRLDPTTYGTASIELLSKSDYLPYELRDKYLACTERIVRVCQPAWSDLEMIRLHGDCHPGNLLWGSNGPFFLDFDDFLTGPPTQDLWLLSPGRDAEADAARDAMVRGYQSMRQFDRKTLRLVEPLRALRIIRYAAWIAHRYADPAFQRAFPDFEEHIFWMREIDEMERQRARVEEALGLSGAIN